MSKEQKEGLTLPGIMQPSHPLTDQSDGRAVLQGRNGRPLPCSFLPSTVADLGQQVRAVRVPVLEDVGRDLDEEGVQLCLVPVFESLRAARVKVKKDTLLLIYTHTYVHTYIYIYVCNTHIQKDPARLTLAISSWSMPRTSFIR